MLIPNSTLFYYYIYYINMHECIFLYNYVPINDIGDFMCNVFHMIDIFLFHFFILLFLDIFNLILYLFFIFFQKLLVTKAPLMQ